MSFGISIKTQKRSLALYLAGVILYYLSYGTQNFFPDSDWSTGTIGFAASVYTNVFWMIGLGLLGDKFYFMERLHYRPIFYIVPAVVFVIFHTTHAVIYHQRSFNRMQLLTLSIISVLFIVLLYLKLLRPWQLRWGATDDEVKCTMPGDDIVQKPNFVATKAVSIKAPPTEVWKWIIQIGSGRAGFYSIDFIDNANVPSSRNIIPKYQIIEQDYFIPFTPNQKNGMWVKDYRESEYILWWDRKGNGTWGWFLQQTEAGNTRLITRLRTKYNFSFPWIIYYILYDFGDIIMMRKCMLGIKARAEKIRVSVITK